MSWSGGGDGPVLVGLFSDLGGKRLGVRCSANASPLTVPAAALATLGLDDAGFTTSLAVGPVSSLSLQEGEYPVTLSVEGSESGGRITVTP